jgi:hypothetical protein
MKQSDSATSLTSLVVCDTACYFCNEPSDPEKGMPLIDTRKFLNCECRLTTHTKCWVHHLAENISDRVVCPLCNTPIAGWKKKEMTDSVKNPDTTPQFTNQSTCCKKTKWCWIICYGLLIGIIITTILLCLKVSGQI